MNGEGVWVELEGGSRCENEMDIVKGYTIVQRYNSLMAVFQNRKFVTHIKYRLT